MTSGSGSGNGFNSGSTYEDEYRAGGGIDAKELPEVDDTERDRLIAELLAMWPAAQDEDDLK